MVNIKIVFNNVFCILYKSFAELSFSTMEGKSNLHPDSDNCLKNSLTRRLKFSIVHLLHDLLFRYVNGVTFQITHMACDTSFEGTLYTEYVIRICCNSVRVFQKNRN